MSHIYISNNGSVMSHKGGRFEIYQKDGVVRSVPQETVESVSVFGNSSITTPCVQKLLAMNIPVCYFSSNGMYFGRLEATSGKRISLEKKQFQNFEDNEFVTLLSKKIIFAKINNQKVIIKRYLNGREEEFKREINIIANMQKKVITAE